MTRRRLTAAAIVTAATALAVPPTASAHGLVGRADLPIPGWLFSWAAVIVLVASFAALAALWPTPRLGRSPTGALPAGLSSVLTSRPVETLGGLIGVAGLVLVLWTSLLGTDNPSVNLAPTFVYVIFWLGLVPLSVVFGDVFRWMNPWRAVGRLVGAGFGARAPDPLEYPHRLGYWPAAAGLLAFGWLELVASEGDRPSTIATAVIVYSIVTWVAMALYGTERWCDRGEAFSVYFGLFARLSPFMREGRQIRLRIPLSGVAALGRAPGMVALVVVMIGVVSFDGFASGAAWQPIADWLIDLYGGSPRSGLTWAYTTGLLGVVAILGAFFLLGVAGARTVGRGPRRRLGELAANFAPSLVPIALAYVAAHYVSLLLFQGQMLAPLASDPLGDGADLLGTGDWRVDYGVIGAETFWYLQVGFVIVGHVAALILSHEKALTIYDDARVAVRSQYWLLGMMAGFTTLALWLLAQANEG